MCGIAGALELNGSRGRADDRILMLERMMALLGHRGPDECGYFLDERAALAAVRLSILDLQHGQQPMADERQRFWVVFNGEIYNYLEIRERLEGLGHRFSTRCDTEVALRAWMEWGEEAPALFNGGFAFAIYDRVQAAAFLVRDRFGKRPLFYTSCGAALVFGSEIKALLAHRQFTPRWDVAGLAAIFAKWTPIGVETPFGGVRQMAPGTILRVTPDGTSEVCYAGFPLPTESAAAGVDDAAAIVRSLLADSVRVRLRSDVEVGVLLSGGFDSTAITRLIHEQQPSRLRSFSICFDDAQFDESDNQQRVVRAFELSHAPLRVSTADIAGAFRSALWHAEIPQFRAAFVPMYLLAAHVRQHGVKVVLSGEGADEVFLGYDLFKEARLRSMWGILGPAERQARILKLYPYLPLFSDHNVRALEALFGRTATGADQPLFSHALRLENGRFALKLLRFEGDGLDGLRRAVAEIDGFAGWSPVRRAQWIEFHTLLQGYLLSSQGDRMMFAHGVEPRCPFLDPAVAAFAARLPEQYLLSENGDEKHVLKQAFRGAIPAEILGRPKQPYRAPDAASFLKPRPDGGGRFAEWAEELVTERRLQTIEPLDSEFALRVVERVRGAGSGATPREDQAFLLLLSLCVLDRQFIHREGEMQAQVRPRLARSANLIGVPTVQ